MSVARRCALLAALLALGQAQAAALVPPPGFTAPVQPDKKNVRECEPAPEPYTGALSFPSKYEGSDAARDKINPQAEARYKAQTADIREMEKRVSSMVSDYLHSGKDETLDCALGWLDAWAGAGALLGPSADHTGKSVRKWALASLASAYLRLKFSSSRPLAGERERAQRIETWFDTLAGRVITEWTNQPLAKVNNHEYWAAWAVMAAAVALNRRDFFDWAVKQYRVAASQVDTEGYLPNELRRDTRALAYHNYALGPLAMIAAFAKANGINLAPEGNYALARLASRVLEGVDDPDLFEGKTGEPQELEDLSDKSKFAWMEAYCWTTRCGKTVAERVASLRPLKTYRLGGDVTELFAPPPKKNRATGAAPAESRTRQAILSPSG